MAMHPRERRAAVFRALAEGLDLLVIGGGINGAGVFRDAALRGLKTGLVEKADFASGTSSRSSKLIHGGVRYLEHLEFGLVRESSAERTALTRILPDLVEPAPFLLPVYCGDRHGLFAMDLGLWLYDALAFFRNFRLHRRLNRAQVLQALPSLNPEGLQGGVLYYDCKVNDARLTLDNILSGSTAGGRAQNYARVVRVEPHAGSAGFDVWIRDELTGTDHLAPCRSLVCAAGPWTNRFLRTLEGAERKILRLTKGIHLLFPKSRFPVDTAAVITSNDDRRIIFVVPWEGYTLVGTTDTDFDGDIDRVIPDSVDVDYLLRLVNSAFPSLCLEPREALSAFAGLRPLLLSGGNASTVSRKDKIIRLDNGALIVGGGKLTTYRSIAERAVDMAIRHLPTHRSFKANPCRTARESLIPRSPDKSWRENGALPNDICTYLDRRFGAQAAEVAALAFSRPELARRIDPDLPFIFAEIPFGVAHERLLTLTDFFRLRTEIFLKSRDNGLSATDEAARLLGEALGILPREAEPQAAAYRAFVRENLDCLRRP